MMALLALAAVADPAFSVSVLDCHDADTCRVDIVERLASAFGPDVMITSHESVRFCDVNAPELKGATKAAAEKSRDAVVGWIKAAKVVEIRPLMKSGRAVREKYGRLLAWVFADGVNLNERLVSEGLAVRYLECR